MLTKIKKFIQMPEKLTLLRMLVESIPLILSSILRGEEVELVIERDKKRGGK